MIEADSVLPSQATSEKSAKAKEALSSVSTNLSADPPPLPDEELPEIPATLHESESHVKITEVNSSTTRSEITTTDGYQKGIPSTAQEGADAWLAVFDPKYEAYYFYNKLTQETTWENPRDAQTTIFDRPAESNTSSRFVQETVDANLAFQAHFNRRTGKFVADPNKTVENYTADARADRQLERFVDPSKSTENGRSLRAERAAKIYTKKEMQAMRSKYKEKKEHRRRAWLIKD